MVTDVERTECKVELIALYRMYRAVLGIPVTYAINIVMARDATVAFSEMTAGAGSRSPRI